MQKFVSSFVAGALVFQALFTPVAALAQTSTTTDLGILIKQLEDQITLLQTQLNALREAQMKVRGTVAETLKLFRQLREGMTGQEVRLLQVLLAADLEIYPEGLVTGFYGKLTAKAVKKFQKKHNLEQVGIVGPKTLKKLQEFLEENKLDEEEDKDDDDDDGDRHEKRVCAKIPPGHLVAPGWLRKHDGKRPIVPTCQILPPGIIKKLPDTATSTPPAPPPASTSTDMTAPIISNIMATSTTSTGTTIKWTTNEFATSWVYYGGTNVLAQNTGSNITTKDHSQNITGLTASTTYKYLAVSKDSSGNTATSTEQSFATLP